MPATTATQAPKSDAPRDARCYPRYRAQIPAQLVTPTGEHLAVGTRMISMVGLEVNCNQLAMLQMMAKNSDKAAHKRRVIHFSIDLPGVSPIAINGTAVLVNSRRLAQDHYVLASEYLKLTETNVEQLAGFLEDCTLA